MYLPRTNYTFKTSHGYNKMELELFYDDKVVSGEEYHVLYTKSRDRFNFAPKLKCIKINPITATAAVVPLEKLVPVLDVRWILWRCVRESTGPETSMYKWGSVKMQFGKKDYVLVFVMKPNYPDFLAVWVQMKPMASKKTSGVAILLPKLIRGTLFNWSNNTKILKNIHLWEDTHMEQTGGTSYHELRNAKYMLYWDMLSTGRALFKEESDSKHDPRASTKMVIDLNFVEMITQGDSIADIVFENTAGSLEPRLYPMVESLLTLEHPSIIIPKNFILMSNKGTSTPTAMPTNIVKRHIKLVTEFGKKLLIDSVSYRDDKSSSTELHWGPEKV